VALHGGAACPTEIGLCGHGLLGRDEVGFFHRPAAAAIEHRDALGSWVFAAGAINVHQQLAAGWGSGDGALAEGDGGSSPLLKHPHVDGTLFGQGQHAIAQIDVVEPRPLAAS